MAKKENQEESGKAAPSSDLEALADIIMGRQNPFLVGGKPFIPLSADEVKALPKKTQDEAADEYYKSLSDLSSFPWSGIHVSSDLQIFLGNVQGENALSNHIAANTVNGVSSVSYKSYPKPN